MSNSAVGSVDSKGTVTARRVGNSTLTVRNSGFSANVPVVVVSTLADWNSDGYVDVDDYRAFGPCYSGPIGEPTFVAASVDCREFFDQDQDGDVDLLDFGVFQAMFFPRVPGDLNCDGVVSFADINPFVLALSGQAAYEAA